MRHLPLTLLLVLGTAGHVLAQEAPTLFWGWTAVFPAIPADTLVAVGQLDGVGPDEIVAYHPQTGAAWVAWIQRDELGEPRYCIDAHQFPPGFASIHIGHFDTWALDGSDRRKDLLLVPRQGPLYFATTHINRAGGCYAGG